MGYIHWMLHSNAGISRQFGHSIFPEGFHSKRSPSYWIVPFLRPCIYCKSLNPIPHRVNTPLLFKHKLDLFRHNGKGGTFPGDYLCRVPISNRQRGIRPYPVGIPPRVFHLGAKSVINKNLLRGGTCKKRVDRTLKPFLSSHLCYINTRLMRGAQKEPV